MTNLMESDAAEMTETKAAHNGNLPVVYAVPHEDHTIYVLEIEVKEELVAEKGDWETVFVHIRPNPVPGNEEGRPEVEYALSRVSKTSHSFSAVSSNLAMDRNIALWEAINYCYHR